MTPKHRPYSLPPEVEDFMSRLRDRLTEARKMRGLSIREACRLCGSTFPKKLEAGCASFVYLDQVFAICRGYDVSLRWVLEGGEPGPCGDLPDDKPTRRNIRALRGSTGTPTVAREAWGREGLQSTLVRWESGAYKRLDLARLYQLARLFHVTLFRLVTGEF